MLSRYNCCPQLVIGNYTLRIFGRPVEKCPDIIIDGIIGSKEAKESSFFRRFLLSVEDHPDRPCKENQLLNRYLLQKEKLSPHASHLLMMVSDKINHINIKRCYGVIKDYCYNDQILHSVPLSDFLINCDETQLLDIVVQIINLYQILEKFFIVLGIDFLHSCKVQSLSTNININLSKDRQISTDLLVKLDDFDYLALSDRDSEYYNLNHPLPNKADSFQAIIDYLNDNNKKVPVTILTLLQQGSFERYLLPKRQEKTNFRSRDSNWFIDNKISTLAQLIEVFKLFKISWINNPFVTTLCIRELRIMKIHLKRINKQLEEGKFTLDDIEDPSIGFGTGIYEKKLIELLRIKSLIQAISYWITLVDYVKVTDQHCVKRIAKIHKRLTRTKDCYNQLLEPIYCHLRLIKHCRDYKSYVEVYRSL